MPRVCTVCLHPQRAEIDQALVAGRPVRETSTLFRVSEDALSRHKAEHLPATLAKAQEAQEVARADSLLSQVRDLHDRTLKILSQAEATGKLETALKAIRETRSNLELLAELMGELDRQPQVNILASPDWLVVQVAIVRALEAFPDARQAVMAALGEVKNGSR